ncbi:hypothetical protein E4Z66_09730 [Aliishimia ponticola]|uniref:Uncharacterized protein n=1 Tax=Aliishimia ponticola TaxID=2499833 RepID=A0A4S4NCM6_9RHOB|nr:hypothetical protein [Aliishimia ponticola]THH37194.1 hypothetical protein E4Z66_09730 [Aliishimia ponticola]
MKDAAPPPQTALRPPGDVMRLSRLGAMFPTRLSFLRILTRQLAAENRVPERALWQMDADGYGRAVYRITFHGHVYALVAVTRPLDAEARSDRVIATAWDAAFVLHDGMPDADDLDRIAQQAPRQEAGRFTARDLVLSRANKSVRLWTHVVERLRAGRQPEADFVGQIGYLMRTTAVYGNGKFGIADRAVLAARPGLGLSFMAEMLTVWLIRHFTHDLVQHVGRAALDPALKRHLGIGNATGLGMAPFLVTHPILLNNWMMVRETALARVRAVETVETGRAQQLRDLHARAAAHLAQWQVPDAARQVELDTLRQEWAALAPAFEDLSGTAPMERLWQDGQGHRLEVQELLLSLMLEPFGDLVDDLAAGLTDAVGGTGQAFETTEDLRAALAQNFSWALGRDYSQPAACARFWYVSEEKQEPRLGNRFDEPGAERESPLDIARRIAALADDLPRRAAPVAAFLQRHPQHLLAVERVQIARACPYSEIHDNLIDAACRPIDMLRAKLALFGATKFDPKSDLWTRVTLAQGALMAADMQGGSAQAGWCPVL